jgi:hypothetical protein
MSTIIHTIRVAKVIDSATTHVRVVCGADQTDVIARAKAAAQSADYYEVETWRINGQDPENEPGEMLTSKTVTAI